MNQRILKINKAGQAIEWISKKKATNLVFNNKVLWSFGNSPIEVRGGINRSGTRSIMQLDPIIAVNGKASDFRVQIALTNQCLFRRDKMCMYCGASDQSRYVMTRDHIIPQSKGGRDIWTNVVQACYQCNQRKADRTPEGASMKLLAVPFMPTFNELLYLQNRNILQDQLIYLEKGFKNVLPLAA
jgi:hypothetical protein